MDIRSNADRIVDAIRKAGKPLKPLQIAELSGVGDDVVRTTVRQMLLKGELSQPGYGLYSLPENDLDISGLLYPDDPDDSPHIPQTRHVQGDVRANPPVTISKSAYKSEAEKPVYTQVSQATLEDKILALVDLDAMKQLMDTGAGDVQEGFFSVFRRMHDGEVYKFTVRVDVELERGQDKRMTKPQTDKGSSREE